MKKTGFRHHTADLASGDLTIKLRVDATSFSRLIQSETSDVPEGRQVVRMKRLTGFDGLLIISDPNNSATVFFSLLLRSHQAFAVRRQKNTSALRFWPYGRGIEAYAIKPTRLGMHISGDKSVVASATIHRRSPCSNKMQPKTFEDTFVACAYGAREHHRHCLISLLIG